MVTENGERDALLARTLINPTSLCGPFILHSFPSRMDPPQPLLLGRDLTHFTLAQAHQMCDISYTQCQTLAPMRTISQDWGRTLPSILQGTSSSGPILSGLLGRANSQRMRCHRLLVLTARSTGSPDTLHVRGYEDLSPEHRDGGIAT